MIVKGACHFKWSGLGSTVVPLDLRSRPAHNGVEVSSVLGGQELDPEGRLGACFGQVQLLE